jgi:hypothetical protein
MAADVFPDPVSIANWAEQVGLAPMMQTRWGWPIAEVFHFFGLCLLFGTIGLFDLRMLGVARGISLRALHQMVPYGVAGFAISITTGFLFFVATPDQYLYNPALQLKLSLMALAGINMVLFYATTASAVSATGANDLPPVRARVFAAVSLACWLGVITCGRVITAFRPPWHWCFWC